MKMLVLGGSRFIGLHLVRLLHSRGHDVTVLNRGRTEADLPEGVARISADRDDAGAQATVLSGASYDVAFDISAYTTRQLGPAIEALSGNVGRFVFCSTTSVYAPNDTIPIWEHFPLDRAPDASKYARDKIECEDLLAEAHAGGFPMTILRPPYVYGPDNYIAAREFSYFARLSGGRRIIIPGDGLTPIHPVHVDDLAEAFAAAAESDAALGGAYTICSPDAITANGYVRAIADAVGVDADVVHVEPRDYDSLGEQIFPFEWQAARVYTTTNALADLDWAPRYHMRDGLAMTYEWWVQQGQDGQDWDFSNEDEALARLGLGGPQPA